ncbi:MAG: hypothetical protein IKF68_07160 [Erysipelotrichaceae bacterium]|nr:hypothetical protein [Erysipelotrichaceae bacterium]
MKVLLKDLVNIADRKVYDVDMKEIAISDDIFINGIKDVKGHISFYYDQDDKLFIEYELKGKMLCPDTLDMKDVEVPFDLHEDEEVAFSEDKEGFYLMDGMDISDLVAYIVIPEAPISVEKKGETMYYSGDGWTISSEEEYNKNSRNRIDPRLEKLLEYKEEE